MRITIEKVENGFLVVFENEKGRVVRIEVDAAAVVDFVKSKITPLTIVE
jgi:hypothetical protein